MTELPIDEKAAGQDFVAPQTDATEQPDAATMNEAGVPTAEGVDQQNVVETNTPVQDEVSTDATTTETESIAPTEATPAEGSSENSADDVDEGRWDKQKAATVAAAQKEDPYFQTNFDRLNGVVQEYTTGDKAEDIKAKQDKLNDLVKRKEQGQEVEDWEVEDAQDRLDRATEGLNYGKEDLKNLVESLTDSIGRLYDANPEAFANMPTKEFMEIADTFRQREQALATLELSALRLADRDKSLDESYQKGEEWDPTGYKNYLTAYRDLVKPRTLDVVEEYDEEKKFDDAIKAAYGFDVSPRARMDMVKSLASDYRAQLEQRLAKYRAAREEVLDKYRTTSEQNSSAQKQ